MAGSDVPIVMIHESAHAVMARFSRFHRLRGDLIVGQSTGEIEVTLFPRKVAQEGLTLGDHLTKDPQVAKDACLIFVAGKVAEIIAGETPSGYTGDYDMARFVLKKAGLNHYAILPVVEADCRRYLEHFWKLVVGLADHVRASERTVVPVDEVDDVLDRLFD